MDRRAEQVISLQGVSRTFRTPGGLVLALRRVSLSVSRGEAVALTGPSGSGKSTLLHLVAGLDRPTTGSITVLGTALDSSTDRALTAFRGQRLGIVLQDSHLLPGLTALENVVIARLPWGRRRQLQVRARDLLVAVGLETRMDFPPARLSGGERQRVGLARALLGDPEVLLADEPTGNLDGGATDDLLALLDRLRQERNLTLMIVTHDAAVAAAADRRLRLVDGSLDVEPGRDLGGAVRTRVLE
ncbi:MAG: ABC transporter ATP-binding protein [Candidatus Dormibacteraeota bacterium]|uniref:ABC transporter ATP-binding protein n=1 Tax=Candidatus Aeolococcus gillhamiae TaxID=3127015 RepID=A0A934N6Z5_9BACT|nr:ABC transporter ATP-binding protein [Candidatus Dormibacteraeota bacterium]